MIKACLFETNKEKLPIKDSQAAASIKKSNQQAKIDNEAKRLVCV